MLNVMEAVRRGIEEKAPNDSPGFSRMIFMRSVFSF